MGQACCTDDTSTRNQVESVERQKSPAPSSQPSEDAVISKAILPEKEEVALASVNLSDGAEGAAQKTNSGTEATTSKSKEAEPGPPAQQTETKKPAESPEESEPSKLKEKPAKTEGDAAAEESQTTVPRASAGNDRKSAGVDPTKSTGVGKGKQIKDDRRPSLTTTAQGSPFPKRPGKDVLSIAVWERAEAVFKKLDVDGSNAVTREEALAFFNGAFGAISVDAMFKSIDVDMSGAITGEEFMHFWKQVKAAGHSDAEILEEMEEILECNQWVDMNIAPTSVAADKHTFPKRPWFCRISAETWNKCEELFRAMAKKGDLVITRDKATAFFDKEGSYGQISANAMFHEVDTMNHGQISPKAFMDFWKQVRSSGYSNKQIMEEIVNMLEGGGWVDWNDGRTT